MNNNVFKGFTLAEVLITLGVIGVVAAMTMPTLIANHQKHEIVSKLKKNVSVIENAFKLSIFEHGYSTYAEDENADSFLDKYLFPYINVMKKCEHSKNNECFNQYTYKLDGKTIDDDINEDWTTFILNDGTSYAVKNETRPTHQQMTMRIDVNGLKKPNRAGRDVFCFVLYTQNNSYPNDLYKMLPCFQIVDQDRNNYVKTNGHCASDKTSHGSGCAALIQMDNWEIKKDYPW